MVSREQIFFKVNLTILSIILISSHQLLAYDFEVDGIYYNIDGNNVAVTYKSYSNTSFYYSDYYKGDHTLNVTTSLSYGTGQGDSFATISGAISANSVIDIRKYTSSNFFEDNDVASLNIPFT